MADSAQAAQGQQPAVSSQTGRESVSMLGAASASSSNLIMHNRSSARLLTHLRLVCQQER